eukprot:gene7219-8027_t
MESQESSFLAKTDADHSAPLESPFKLIKVKGNKDGLPNLGLQTSLQPASMLNSSAVSPPTVATASSPTSATKLIALNPFTLSKFQKTTPLNGSNATRVSPSTVLTGASGKDVSDQLITDLKNEIASLRKEIESKDAKLSSSMRSIKMFWSPELKKERAGRKEDVERLLGLKNQYDTLATEVKKKSSRISELEDELEVGKEKSNKTQHDEVLKTKAGDIEELQGKNNQLKKDLSGMKHEFDEIKESNDLKSIELSARDSLIKSLKTEIDDLQSKQVKYKHSEEEHMETMNKNISDLEAKLSAKEDEVTKLCKEMKVMKEAGVKSKSIIEEKDLCIQKCEADMKDIAQEIINLEEKCRQEEEERKVLIFQLKKRTEEVDLVKSKTADLESEVKTTREEKAKLEATIEELKKESNDLTKELESLQESSIAKENDINSLQKQVDDLKMVVDEKEKVIIEKEGAIGSMKTSRRRESVEANDLKSVLEGRNKELESLNKKYEKLDTYLSHRETALSHARDELAEIKSKHLNCTSTINFMESQIADKDQLIARLEKQRNRLEKEKDDEVANANSCKDNIETLNRQLQDKCELIKDLEAKVSTLKSRMKENKNMETSESTVREKNEKIKSLELELIKSNETIKNLEKDFVEKRNKEDSEKSLNRLSDDGPKRHSGHIKDSKMIKQLWDEISKKDSRLQDLEKQLKERGRQLTNLRKTQTAEREKQAQYLTDKSKLEGESHNRVTDLQAELLKKDDRITMLEDALRESVSIAAEREELLAQHVELSEGASQTIHELEADTDRLTMEKGITNIKNAFLILSLGERDAVVASLKSLRRRSIEELMNIKQTALLSAISEKDANIALLELQSSSKGRKQEIKQLKQEKDKLVNELKEQTQQRITITNNEENKDGLLYKELEDAPVELVLQALRNISDSSDKLEYYIDALLSFVKDRNLEILKEVPSLQRRSSKGLDKLRNVGKSQLLRELQKLEEDCSQLKSFVDILLEKLECV